MITAEKYARFMRRFISADAAIACLHPMDRGYVIMICVAEHEQLQGF